MNRAIAINNDGASLLSSGNVLDAILTLRNAMIVLKDDTLGNDIAVHHTVSPRSSERCGQAADIPKDDVLFMYSRPLIFPTDLAAVKCDEMNTLRNSLGAYTIFNLALACHLHGLTTGTDAPLQRACQMYHIVIGAPFLPLTASPHGIMPCELLQLLAFNNLAHIYHNRCDFQESLHCMIECAESEEDFYTSGFLTDDEIQDIYMNRMLVEVHCAAKAA